MKLQIHKQELILKDPFTISRSTRTRVDSLVVALTDGPYIGYGEATANPYYHTTTAMFERELLEKKTLLEIDAAMEPADFWAYLAPHFRNNSFLLCALDEAYADLFAKKRGIRLFEYWKLNEKNAPFSSYTIGIDTIDIMLKKMKETPFPIYKIKLGTKNDLKIVSELRKHSTAIFRIDANCGWTPEETVQNSKQLQVLGVEFIEQPLPSNDLEGQMYVMKNSVLPIVADESCQVESDVKKCASFFHGVNIKLMKCGGLTPAKRMIDEAKKLGLKTMLGCMTESSVGISALAQLAPLVDFTDMDGALLIKNDPAKGVIIKEGKVTYSKINGTGVAWVPPEKNL